ncbi:CDP-archaeol synthase [Winogradskyella sp.]|uniref:CDP-archaeol synthase n=1 Tax=Winogradskyella sp. TaxID=1883156 RepID=UPI003BAA71EC
MDSLSHHLVVVLLPLILSNVLHLLVIKSNSFSYLKHPISDQNFGTNKTWRGFIFVPMTNALILNIVDLTFNLGLTNSYGLGALLGLAYMLFELPNSFIKRQLGIRPGGQSNSNPILFSLIDKTDSAFGVSLIYYVLGYADFKSVLLLFICSSVTHVLMSKLLVQLKLKTSF